MVTVIIPTFNRSSTLKNSIRSVLSQTYKDIELLIIDDGSTDDTYEVVNGFDDSRIRYIHYSPNQGAAHARNVGIEKANGDYIAFHDSDDLMVPNRIEKQLEFLLQEGVDFVFAQVYEHGIKGNDLGKSPTKSDIGIESNKNVHNLLLQWQVWCQTVICTKECAKDIMFDERFPCGIDWDFSIRVAMKYKMKFQELVVSNNYRMSSSISANNKNHIRAFYLLFNKYKTIIDEDEELKNYYSLKDFEYKYSFGFVALKESITAFKISLNPLYVFRGIRSLFYSNHFDQMS